jgi:hypothetical protein
MGRAEAFVGGLVIFIVGYGFFTGFFPNATYTYWLAEAVANGTIFMGLGVIVMAMSVLSRGR